MNSRSSWLAAPQINIKDNETGKLFVGQQVPYIDNSIVTQVGGQNQSFKYKDVGVILEVTPPEAPYWSIQLTSHYWEGLDWNLRLTSFNGHQACIDDDGKFRAVISHTDPGVPNWLDAGAHDIGLVTARYYKAKSVPVPQMRTVPLTAVRQYLPKSTPHVTWQQRQETLRLRAQSVTRRMM